MHLLGEPAKGHYDFIMREKSERRRKRAGIQNLEEASALPLCYNHGPIEYFNFRELESQSRDLLIIVLLSARQCLRPLGHPHPKVFPSSFASYNGSS